MDNQSSHSKIANVAPVGASDRTSTSRGRDCAHLLELDDVRDVARAVELEQLVRAPRSAASDDIALSLSSETTVHSVADRDPGADAGGGPDAT